MFQNLLADLTDGDGWDTVVGDPVTDKTLAASRPARPSFIGMGRSGHSDTSARADEILRETGFGE
ncbi:hypothetical protein [Streptomyces sp. NPDC088350]|uniref:hypothetical protein n=1 Tax=Streptomyces sp. NPDC088350 TaxID=3365854 RepID=UPI0037FED55D